MKSLMSLWSRIAEESAILCHTSAILDINTVEERVEKEGLSFLTITLPTLGKLFQQWLDQGAAGPSPGFESWGRLPRFLGGYFVRIFDSRTGVLLDTPCIESIIAVRQLTLMFGKINLECSKERKRDAIRRYVQCEHDVRQFDNEVLWSDLEDFMNMSHLLYGDLFAKLELRLEQGPLLPKHGPGATADGISSNGKYSSRTWTSRLLEGGFHPSEYLYPSPYTSVLEGDEVTIIEPGSELPVKVTLVPKTMKTPRVIAMEPTCMQYMQQAVYHSLLEFLEGDRLLSKMIGFDDQTPNQRMAMVGSLGRGLATLDLSDASDRVSNLLVRVMLRRWPRLNAAVGASRSERASLPGSTDVIQLAKFASMGSALCFPVEAMVFTTLVFLGIQKSLSTSLTRKDIKSFSDEVRVYGDDIICPVDHVLSVVETLELFGARVGLDKSFWTGRFRESCGKEYYAGQDVSIVRVRELLPTRRQDADAVSSAVSLRNQLYQAGYWQTVALLDNHIEKVIKYFPNVAPTSALLGRDCSLGYLTEEVLGSDSQRTDPYRHVPLVRGYRVVAKSPPDHLEGTGALLKCLLKLEHGSLVPKGPYPLLNAFESINMDSGEHLERAGRPKRVDIKLGWRPPY